VCRSCFDKACAERTVYPSRASLREPQGERWVEAPVLSEPSTLREPPFESLRANGEPKGSCFDKLMLRQAQQNGISIGYPALRGIHPEPFLRLRSGHSEKPFTLSVSKGERLFRTGRSKGDADFLRDHLIYIIGIFLEILICK